MYIAPRPHIDDDPLFPIRAALMPCIGLVLAMALRSPMAMLYPVLMFALLASNRKAFNPARVFATPFVFGGALWLMSGIVLLFQGLPSVLMVLMASFYFLAFYMIQRTGTAVGMLIIMAGVMMSIMGLGNYTAMSYMRAEMTKAALCSALVIPVLYALLPPRTTDLHVDDTAPSYGYGWGRRAAIRTAVLMAYSAFLYTILDATNVMLAISGMFVLVHSTRQSIWWEARQRSFSVLLGGALGLAILASLQWVGHLFVLLALVFLATLWLGEKMLHGRLASMAYQDAASVMISLVGSALTTSEPGFAFIQRAGLTIAGTLVAALVVSILDTLLISEPDSLADAEDDRAALENL